MTTSLDDHSQAGKRPLPLPRTGMRYGGIFRAKLLLLAPALPGRLLHPDISQSFLEEADVAGGEVRAVEAEVGPEAAARVVQELVKEVEPVEVLGLVHHAPEHAGMIGFGLV